ncbi:MAG: porin [Alphaproteobacteria bacterium]|nr:porin [Alphaproteobacteria bacterium]
MKKLLLGTTAILGAVSFASVAAADAPRVTVGGFIDFQAVQVDEDQAPAGSNDYGFRNDTEIHFSVDGKTDAGLGYGAVVELEADATLDSTNSGENADRTYVYMDGMWGRFELGTNTDAATALKVDASTIARATGGIDGDWFRFVMAPTGNFIIRPDLPVSHGGSTTPGETENAGKITYYSPSFSGLQLGLSYTPDTDARGQDTFGVGVGANPAFTAAGLGVGYEDVFSGGLTYNRQFDQVALGLSATGEYGDATAGGDDLEAYALGASVGLAGFSLAGSWGDIEGAASGDGDFWTVGAAYDFGAFGASVSWLDSEIEVVGGDNEFENLSFGVDYAVAPGMTPYAEVSLFDYNGNALLGDNDGTVFIVGTQLAF